MGIMCVATLGYIPGVQRGQRLPMPLEAADGGGGHGAGGWQCLAALELLALLLLVEWQLQCCGWRLLTAPLPLGAADGGGGCGIGGWWCLTVPMPLALAVVVDWQPGCWWLAEPCGSVAVGARGGGGPATMALADSSALWLHLCWRWDGWRSGGRDVGGQWCLAAPVPSALGISIGSYSAAFEAAAMALAAVGALQLHHRWCQHGAEWWPWR